ncbi:MAG TPA: DMT family transporter [Acidimicrobiales bacterium]|nr:DMT family transporter [Acidimicrobiales bacterium]
MRPALLLAAVCLGWGTIPLVADEAGLPPAALTFSRVWIAAAGLGLLLVSTRPSGPKLLSISPVRSLATGAVLAAHWTAMFAAYERVPASAVIFLIFLAPIGIAAVERPARRLVLALAVAVVGFALVAGPTAEGADRSTATGIAWAVVAGALFVVLVLLAKPLAAAYGGLRLTFLEMVVAGVVLIPVALLTDWTGLERALPWLLLLGLAHTAIGTAVYLRTLAVLPATEVGILGYLEPVGVVVFAWLLVGDQPGLATIIGGAIVVIAGAVAVSAPASDRSEVPGVPR